jgi:prophage regulatory protein
MSRILRIKDVAALTGLSRATIYRLARAGKFPSFFKLSSVASGFDSAEVEAWLRERKAANTSNARRPAL